MTPVDIALLPDFEMAHYLEDIQAVADYLNIVMEENDSEAFAEALRTVCRAVEIGKIEPLAEQSMNALQSGQPVSFLEISRIFRALGLRMMAQVA